MCLLLDYALFAGGACTYNSTLNVYVIAGTGGVKFSSDLVTWATSISNATEQRSRLFSVGGYVIKCLVSVVLWRNLLDGS